LSASAQVVKPQRDITTITLGSGPIALLRTSIDMNNAHPIDTVSFYRPRAQGPALQVPFEMNDDYPPVLPLRSGADCAISGFRAIKVGERLQVVYATRKGNWAERKKVSFMIFELASNSEALPGVPSEYFKQSKTVSSRNDYCDVNEALEKEASLYGAGK
jgi:hypothetical protein